MSMGINRGMAISLGVPALPKYGPFLGTNMDFATDTVWGKGVGWTIGAGVASYSTGGSATLLSQASVFDEIGAQYFAQIFVQSINPGAGFQIYSGTTTTIPATFVGSSAGATGLFEGVITSYSTTLVIRGGASGIGSVDYATIRKVLR